MVILPDVGGMKPVTMRMVVDLPAPFGPRKPSTSPRSTVNETSFTASLVPNALVRFSTLIMFPPAVPRDRGEALLIFLFGAGLCPARIIAGACQPRELLTGELSKVPPRCALRPFDLP